MSAIHITISNILVTAILYSILMSMPFARTLASEPSKLETSEYIINTDSPEEKPRISPTRTKVSCRAETSEKIIIENTDYFRMEIEDTQLEELSAEFGIGLDSYGVQAQVKLRNALLNKSTNIASESFRVSTIKETTIEPLTCYDQQALIKYDEKSYTWKLFKKGWLGITSEHAAIKWWEPTNLEVEIRALYNEKCANRCRIRDLNGREPSERLIDSDGDKATVRIVYSKNRSYEIPLYFDEEYNLIEPWPFVPKEARCFILRDRGIRSEGCPPEN